MNILKKALKNKIFKNKNRKFIITLLIFMSISVIYTLICDYTSPLYYFDYSPDNNTFFTVGRAMMHGIVPYKMLFEQKGPYFYLMHGLASLITPHSLVGMFPFELISVFCTVLFSYKIAKVLTNRIYFSIISSLFVPILYFWHPYFDYGDTCESILFPAITYLIYKVVQHDNYSYRLNVLFTLSRKEWFIQGILVGIIFLTKYTLLGSWIAFYIATFILYLKKRQFKYIWKMAWNSFIGFILTLIPWAIYFGLNKGLTMFVRVYFYDNIVKYNPSNLSIAPNILQSLINVSGFFRNSMAFTLLLVIFVFMMLKKTIFKTPFGKTLFLAIAISNAIFEFWGYQIGAIYQYYELSLLPYFIPVIIFILIIIFNKFFEYSKYKATIFIAALVVSFFSVISVNNNVSSSKLFPNNSSVTLSTKLKKHYEPYQILFGNYIRHHCNVKRSSLLEYGSISLGVYTTSGIEPTNYYFQGYNFSEYQFPNVSRAQRKSVNEGKTQWLVLNTPLVNNIYDWRGNPAQVDKINDGDVNTGTARIAKGIVKHYRLIMRHKQSFESNNTAYYLFKRRKHAWSNAKVKKFLKRQFAGRYLVENHGKKLLKEETVQPINH